MKKKRPIQLTARIDMDGQANNSVYDKQQIEILISENWSYIGIYSEKNPKNIRLFQNL